MGWSATLWTHVSHQETFLSELAKATLWDMSHNKPKFDGKLWPRFRSHYLFMLHHLSTEWRHCCPHAENVWWSWNEPSTLIKHCKGSKNTLTWIGWVREKKWSYYSAKVAPSCRTVTKISNVIPLKIFNTASLPGWEMALRAGLCCRTTMES